MLLMQLTKLLSMHIFLLINKYHIEVMGEDNVFSNHYKKISFLGQNILSLKIRISYAKTFLDKKIFRIMFVTLFSLLKVS